jgi:hypothetical protein
MLLKAKREGLMLSLGGDAIAAVVFVGIAAPPIDTLMKPFVTEAIFILLCIAFVRLEPALLRGYIGRPGIVLAATAWTMLAIPSLFALSCLVLRVNTDAPDLFLAVMLQAVASPMMAAPAFAALMGLDATLVLVTLIASSILTPLTAPLFVYASVGSGLTLSPVTLGLKLFAILAGSLLVGVTIRRLAGAAAIARYRDELDGFNIVVVFVFVGAVMENVATRFATAPLIMLGLAALAFGVSFAVIGLTFLVFARAGHERALVLGLMASQRNMGLMLAATGSALPELAWIWFALCQFPIYLAPQILTPLTHRLSAPRASVEAPPV